jgi:hypothetical protein
MSTYVECYNIGPHGVANLHYDIERTTSIERMQKTLDNLEECNQLALMRKLKWKYDGINSNEYI